MKRSEMVKQIAKELRAQSSGNTDIDSDQLLSVIEALGMNPPALKKEVANKNGYFISPYHWEKE